MNASDNPEPDRVVGFPGADECARRLRLEVERLSRLPTVEWQYYVEYEGHAEKFGVDKAVLRRMVEAVVKETEKKEREKQAERRRIEARADKQRVTKDREEERKADKKERLDRQTKKEDERKAEKKERERQKALAAIAKLPRNEHEAKLRELSRRLDEDLDGLREELALLLADAETAKVRAADEPWDEPVDGKELLDETEALLRDYVVIHDDASATIYTLTVPFAWIHNEIAIWSPIVLVQGADSVAGKSLLCDIHSLLTPRAHVIVKPTGPSLYRLVDYHRPTLYVDNGDRLLARDRDLADIINSGTTRGHRIPRMVKGSLYEFDPFGLKFINGIDLLPHLEPATRTRCVTTVMLPKLPGETVIHFKHAASDERFPILRRKWLRWSNDNVTTIKSADPSMPQGFNDRLAENYALLFAIADAAGSGWPDRMRKGAVKLTRAYNEPSLGLRCLAQLYEFFETYGVLGRAGTLLITAELLEKLFEATQEDDWCNYRGSGHPINHWQISELLRPFYRGPEPRPLIHPPGETARGHDAVWYEISFKHFLGKPPPRNRSTVRGGKSKKLKK
jgi:hypothetical protein